MDSPSPENRKQTRYKTSKKNIVKTEAKIPIKNNAKSALKKKKRFRRAGGIIYIGHIPHGFYEDEMKSYFNQFGKVLAATVARSKKTGRSRGFGFVEFKDEEVAKIAAETMNNYLMFNKILKCRYIPPEEGRGRIIERKITPYDFPRQRNRKLNEQEKEKAFSKLTQETYLQKAQAKIDQFKKFFEERGVEFSFQLQPTSNTSTPASKKIKTSTGTYASIKSEPQKDADSEFGVLEIDESENEISFTTPPHVKKVIKKSLSSSGTPVKQKVKESKKSQTGKQKISPLKCKIQRKGKIQKKTNKNATSIGKKLVQKTKNKEKSLKAKEFLGKNISTSVKQRKGNLRNIKVEERTGKIQKNTTLMQETGNALRSSKKKIKIPVPA